MSVIRSFAVRNLVSMFGHFIASAILEANPSTPPSRLQAALTTHSIADAVSLWWMSFAIWPNIASRFTAVRTRAI
jgi:hypothetical protein